QDVVPDIGKELQESEYPQRVPEPGERSEPTAEHGANNGCRDRDEPESDAPLIGVVPHVDEKRTGQRLRELIGDLVKDNEGEDFERARPGQKTEKRLPDSVAQRSRGRWLYFGLGGLPGDERYGQHD